jgi:hypothetical protein
MQIDRDEAVQRIRDEQHDNESDEVPHHCRILLSVGQ